MYQLEQMEKYNEQKLFVPIVDLAFKIRFNIFVIFLQFNIIEKVATLAFD